MASELSLDCKTQQSYSMLIKSLGVQSEHAQKLEEFLSRLEEERLKIDAFKRELPLCMQLISNAVEASRQQLQTYRANQYHEAKPTLEEFIPLRAANSSETTDAAVPKMTTMNNLSDKSNWMTSAQLWSQTGDANKQKPMNEAGAGIVVKKPIINGGAFLPFTKERNGSRSTVVVGAGTILPELSLVSSENRTEDKTYESGNEENGVGNINRNSTAILAERNPIKLQSAGVSHIHHNTSNSNHGSSNINTSGASNNNQTHRKARRCWSPDLHRRFVSALQMLGGSQVATPKQIRELMKVDGLTNDEVKSHLQKYRLHTRRPSPSPSPQTGTAAPPHLVVLGGIWVSPEYATAAAAAAAHGTTPAIFGAHPSTHVAPPHYGVTGPHHEIFSPPPPPHHEILHAHRQQQQQLHGALHSHSSPESGTRGGDRSESIEDGKSESSSGKGGDSSGENNNEGLEIKASVHRGRDASGLESHGSEMTLKF